MDESNYREFLQSLRSKTDINYTLAHYDMMRWRAADDICALRNALLELYNGQAEYITINQLGPVNHNQDMKRAYDLLKVVGMVEYLYKPTPKVDRSKTQLTSGEPVPTDRSHTELKPNGQQQGYVVLNAEERAKGFVKPLRDAYKHTVCGGVTTMNGELAETYARDPYFYSGTFCCGCHKHFPLDQFMWLDSWGNEVESMDTLLQDKP